MNRCQRISRHSFAPTALGAALAGAAALFLLSSPLSAHAQTEVPVPQTQNEAAVGGRNFPIGTLRGQFIVLSTPDVQLDGQPDRLAPGARIRSAQNMLVMPGAIAGQNLLVNYTRDAAGLLREVWILTPDEAGAKRVSAQPPLLNFWPFVSSSSNNDASAGQ